MIIANKSIKLILLIFLSTACTHDLYNTDKKLPDRSNDEDIVIHKEEIMYRYEGKIISIPVYRGIEQDILLEKNSSLDDIVFRIPSNISATEYFNNFIKFYAKNLMKDIRIEPTYIRKEQHYYILWYDFEYENIPFSMMLIVRASDEALRSDSIKNIKIDNMAEVIVVNFRIGSSPYLKFSGIPY